MCKSTMNQLATTKNKYQGNTPRVLFICSAGLLRSATASHVFCSEPYNWNTRSAASNSEYGLNIVNEALLEWADLICVMQEEHIFLMQNLDINFDKYSHKVVNLNIPDMFMYRDPEMIRLLKQHVVNYVDKEKFPFVS